MKHEWIPLVRVGPLRFNADVSPYVADGTLVPAPFENDIGHALGQDRYTYSDDEETAVYVEDGRIASISCDDRCVLRGHNLIGLDYDRVRELIGSEPEGEPDIQPVIDELREQFSFNQVGAFVWVKDRKVLSITCHDGSD